MRGALILVDPPEWLVTQIVRVAATPVGRFAAIECRYDDLRAPVSITVDPLGEVRQDGVFGVLSIGENDRGE